MGLFDFFKSKGSRSKSKPSQASEQAPPQSDRDQALEKYRQDPFTFSGQNLLICFKQAYTHTVASGQPGVHVDTLLSAIGACAGFGCQIGIREELLNSGKASEAEVFVVANCANGEKLFFGDTLNQPLLEAEDSVWILVAGAAAKSGATELPDIREIAKFVTSSACTEAFGTIRPEGHQPHEKPIETLQRQWTSVYGLFKSLGVPPSHYGKVLGLSAHLLIIEAKDVIAPKIAAQIVMEAAVAMAKIDPKVIGFESPPANTAGLSK